jgi:hypothetical protein
VILLYCIVLYCTNYSQVNYDITNGVKYLCSVWFNFYQSIFNRNILYLFYIQYEEEELEEVDEEGEDDDVEDEEEEKACLLFICRLV